MRICFISPYSPKEISGVGIFISELSKGLASHSIDSMVITRKVQVIKELPLDIIEIDFPRLRYLGGSVFTLKTIKAMIRSRRDIDIILLQRPFIVSQAFFALISKFIGLPTISVIHGRYPPYKNRLRLKLTRFIERITFYLSDSVIFVDKKGMQLRNYKKGILIENGVDVNHYRFSLEARRRTRNKLKIKDGDFIMIFVGRISQDKGINELLNAVYSINKTGEREIKVLLVGPVAKNEERGFKNYIRKHNLEDNIIFLGVEDDVQPFYCAADVFVLPSYEEGLPLTLLEALACGLPVIVSRIGGIPFVVEDHKDGLLINPGDHKDLIDKLNWCIQNPTEMKDLGVNGNKKVREMYSLARMTGDYVRELVKLNK
jgi:glycosyltransferase involved in cell wall biosynthesis